MKAVSEGTMRITDGFVDEMYFCLDCQACETVCPAGVQYGVLVEAARTQIARSGSDPWKLRLLRNIVLRGILSSQSRLRSSSTLGRFLQTIGLFRLLSVFPMVPTSVREFTRWLPPIPSGLFSDSAAEVHRPWGAARYRVGFLSGCVMNVLHQDVHRDSVDVLLKNGCEVFIPKKQLCCGSLLAHYGDIDAAQRLARANVEAFTEGSVDAIVVNSAGCSAFMKEYGSLLQNDALYAERAALLASKTRDIVEFLTEIGFTKPTGRLQSRVTYHDACHHIHSQQISRQPRDILRSIPGVQLVELEESSWCCGSAGMYNLLRYEDSTKMLERKMENIRQRGADVVCTGNPGCLLQLQLGSRKFGVPVEPLHVVTLLRRSYGRGTSA